MAWSVFSQRIHVSFNSGGHLAALLRPSLPPALLFFFLLMDLNMSFRLLWFFFR